MIASLNAGGVIHIDVGDVVTEAQPVPMSVDVRSSDEAQSESHVHGTDTGGPHTQIPNFEVRIREIDEAINADPTFLKSNIPNLDPYLAISGKEWHSGSNVSIMKSLGSPSKSSEKEIAD